ncbi:MAG: hypothetical protein FJ290_13365 [Planctomycetes bacterium]|nr:hypothetical protein [Planctomycetota bacterium]
MRLYLDTCVLNDAFPLVGLATGERIRKGHLKKPIVRWAKEYAALYHVLDLDDQWDLTFGTSGETLEEIRRYQPKNSLCAAKKSFLEQMQNELFENFVRKCEAVPNRRPSDVLRRIESVVGAGPDAMHLYSAIVAGWDFFITTDFQTIIRRREELERAFATIYGKQLFIAFGEPHYRSCADPVIRIASPLEFIEKHFMPFETLIRTLYGSWTDPDAYLRGLARELLALEKP